MLNRQLVLLIACVVLVACDRPVGGVTSYNVPLTRVRVVAEPVGVPGGEPGRFEGFVSYYLDASGAEVRHGDSLFVNWNDTVSDKALIAEQQVFIHGKLTVRRTFLVQPKSLYEDLAVRMGP